MRYAWRSSAWAVRPKPTLIRCSLAQAAARAPARHEDEPRPSTGDADVRWALRTLALDLSQLLSNMDSATQAVRCRLYNERCMLRERSSTPMSGTLFDCSCQATGNTPCPEATLAKARWLQEAHIS
jgi:hypothetical protein